MEKNVEPSGCENRGRRVCIIFGGILCAVRYSTCKRSRCENLRLFRVYFSNAWSQPVAQYSQSYVCRGRSHCLRGRRCCLAGCRIACFKPTLYSTQIVECRRRRENKKIDRSIRTGIVFLPAFIGFEGRGGVQDSFGIAIGSKQD